MSDLAVPQHIEAERRAQNEAQKEEANNGSASVQDAYVEPTELVLDPSLLTTSLLERMPEPTGWRILVLPYKGKGVTDGGIVLPDSVIDREALASQGLGFDWPLCRRSFQTGRRCGSQDYQ